LGVLVASVTVAIAFYLWPFSFLTVQISGLEYHPANPVGAWIFSAGFVVAGLIIAPHAAYLNSILQPDCKWVSRLSATFVGVAGLGIVGVGIFVPGYANTAHDVSGVLAFGGIGLSCFLSLFPIAKKMLRKELWPKRWQIAVTYGQLIAVLVITVVLTGIPAFEEMQAGTFSWIMPPPAWPLCEWLLLFSAVAWAVGMVAISPAMKGNA
jgi:hypothetical membrane protein